MRRPISRREFTRLAAAAGAVAIVPFGSATSVVAINDRLDPRSGRSVLASFEVRAGDPRAHRI